MGKENNSSQSNTAIWVSVITGVFALCGVIVTVLFGPIVQKKLETPATQPPIIITVIPTSNIPTSTPSFAPDSSTPFTPTYTPSPTDTPITPTDTDTPLPPTSQFNGYIGTWFNFDRSPTPKSVTYALTALMISKADGDAIIIGGCRTRNSENEQISLTPNSVIATFNDDIMIGNPFTISPTVRWSIKLKLSQNILVATVEEYTTQLVFLNSEEFQLKQDFITYHPSCF